MAPNRYVHTGDAFTGIPPDQFGHGIHSTQVGYGMYKTKKSRRPQKGYGLFSNLKSMAAPIAKKAALDGLKALPKILTAKNKKAAIQQVVKRVGSAAAAEAVQTALGGRTTKSKYRKGRKVKSRRVRKRLRL